MLAAIPDDQPVNIGPQYGSEFRLALGVNGPRRRQNRNMEIEVIQLVPRQRWKARIVEGRLARILDHIVNQTALRRERTAATAQALSANAELTVLQKAIAPSQASYYLERGYDRVS